MPSAELAVDNRLVTTITTPAGLRRLAPAPQAFVFNYRKTMPDAKELLAMDIPAFLRRSGA